VPLHGALTPLVHLQAKEALNSQFRQRTQVTREDVGLKRLDTPALAEGAGLWGDVPWRLATGNERLTGLLVGNRIDHLWVCGGSGSRTGGGKGWWGWEADIPLATAEGRARVCSSEHSNEPLGRTVLLHQGGNRLSKSAAFPEPCPTA